MCLHFSSRARGSSFPLDVCVLRLTHTTTQPKQNLASSSSSALTRVAVKQCGSLAHTMSPSPRTALTFRAGPPESKSVSHKKNPSPQLLAQEEASLPSWARSSLLWFKICTDRASLVAQWLRIRLPMRGTQVRALVREDPTCRGATKPVRHNYWACVPQLLKPTCLEPMLRNKRSHCNEKPAHRNKE